MRSNTHNDVRWSRTTSTAPLLPSRSYHFHLSSSGAMSAHHPQAANHPDSWCRTLCVPPLHHLICVCITSRPALCPWLTQHLAVPANRMGPAGPKDGGLCCQRGVHRHERAETLTREERYTGMVMVCPCLSLVAQYAHLDPSALSAPRPVF